jgi:hypothetical protein
VRFGNISPFAAPIGINPAFLLEYFFSRVSLFGTEGRCANQFDYGLYAIFVQVRNAGRELVGMTATLYNKRFFDQSDGKTATDPQPEIVVFTSGQRFVKESD